ncbi:MAG TPA: protein-glutamate O-methyltransferase CheR [Candidatus Sulfotelmatobacter sp.]|nr:protein-glutamate O-methyltransferase CheR [Candidatus Sulfotelmatobacter sp.]
MLSSSFPPPPDVDLAAYAQLRALILEAGGIDLELYKGRCLLRRIAARQRATGSGGLRDYLVLVRRDPIERGRLVKLLTIHVSQFFRNPSTFHAIQAQVLPALLAAKRHQGGRALRLWSVGCACGEEAYSLALLLLESAPEALREFSCAIYGTDIEPDCLRLARQACYPAASLAHLPPAWRQRYFTPIGQRYQLQSAVRALVTFRQHNILDPFPFRRVDLVVFRNVLIYMTEALQERLLLALYDTLGRPGFLVLGKVEGLAGAAQKRFVALDPAERIYQKAE